jgi:hypothetical protein
VEGSEEEGSEAGWEGTATGTCRRRRRPSGLSGLPIAITRIHFAAVVADATRFAFAIRTARIIVVSAVPVVDVANCGLLSLTVPSSARVGETAVVAHASNGAIRRIHIAAAVRIAPIIVVAAVVALAVCWNCALADLASGARGRVSPCDHITVVAIGVVVARASLPFCLTPVVVSNSSVSRVATRKSWRQ